MDYTTEKIANIYQTLKTDPNKGLTGEQVSEIQGAKGLNVLLEGKKETVLQKIFCHLKDFTSLILIVAGLIALYLAITSDHGYTDAIVIFVIIIFNITLAIRQEMGAEKALEALKRMSSPMTVVIRDGRRQSIEASELVPGDILTLESGNMIPADARIIESINLKVEESALTDRKSVV